MAVNAQVSNLLLPAVDRATDDPSGQVPHAGSEFERCVSQIRVLFRSGDIGIRFLLADRRGHLRVMYTEGDSMRLGRMQSERRRMTFADGITRTIEGPDGRAVGIFPIDRRGQAIGVCELTADAWTLERWRWDVEAALGRCSSSLRHRVERRDLDIGLAWTAHELRGPLRATKLWLENAASSDRHAGSAHLARAIGELTRLADGVESVLQWSVGNETLRQGRVDLVSLAHEAVDCCVAETGQDRVIVEGDDHLVVRADALHLRSAIENLVRNGLHHSARGTKVHVIVELRDGHPTVVVENEGPAIPDEHKRSIFEPLAHGRTGTGLGLFVADRVVQRHGGTIHCFEPAEGRVAFEVRLPPGVRP
jgi:signal transduction histidine kinase